MPNSESGSYVALNAVLKVKDGVTGKPIKEAISFELDGTPCQPLTKGDGFFVFPNYVYKTLPHVLKIRAAGFFDMETPLLPITEPLAEACQILMLYPSPAYNYPSSMALIAGYVLNDANQGIDDVIVAVTIEGKRGATRSDPAGHYMLALSLAVDSVKAELRFTKEGCLATTRSVSVTNASVTSVDNVIMQKSTS